MSELHSKSRPFGGPLYAESFKDIASKLRIALEFEKNQFVTVTRRFRFANKHTSHIDAPREMKLEHEKLLERLARRKVLVHGSVPGAKRTTVTGAFFASPTHLREHEDLAVKVLAEERAESVVRWAAEALGRLTWKARRGLTTPATLWRRLKVIPGVQSRKAAVECWRIVLVTLKEEYRSKFGNVADDGWATVEESIRAAGILAEQYRPPEEYLPPMDGEGELPPSREKAYQLYDYAVTHEAGPSNHNDKAVYKWLVEHVGKDDVPWTLKSFQTLLGQARKHHGTSKHTPRTGRKGKNVRTPDEL